MAATWNHRDHAITVGVLTPHAAAGPEEELPAMAPAQVVTRLSRILAPDDDVRAPQPPTRPSGLRALTHPAVMDRAAAAFEGDSLDALGYASTSTGYAIGVDAEAAMLERLSRRWDLPVVSTSLAAVAAVQALHVHRIVLVHPPWFDEELNDLGAAYFCSQGIEVLSSSSADLVNDPSRIEPDAIVEWVARHVSDEAEAVFIGGTGFRAARAIEALEERIGRAVLESNQVLLWSILAKVGADVEIRGYGRLLERGHA